MLWITHYQRHAELNQPIGSIAVVEHDDRVGKAHIGYCIGKSWWGKGIMPEAVNAVIDYLFNDLNLDFLTCGYYDFNSQSKRVQEKCGFKPYRKLEFETRLGTKEQSTLNLLINPNKKITFVFSHPETLIYKED